MSEWRGARHHDYLGRMFHSYHNFSEWAGDQVHGPAHPLHYLPLRTRKKVGGGGGGGGVIRYHHGKDLQGSSSLPSHHA